MTTSNRLLFTLLLFPIFSSFSQGSYLGKPWNSTVQQIPGKIQCELFDLGGEGVAYHDADTVNNGSGHLNKSNGIWLNDFRINEGVDITYTKGGEYDTNPYNVVKPELDQLYVGWTSPGEWMNYSVNVNKSGVYTIGIMYTSNGGGEIALDLDGKSLTSNLQIPATSTEKEPLGWRQYHHWNRVDVLTTIKLEKGVHLLKLKTVTNGKMNYDYLDFKLKN